MFARTVLCVSADKTGVSDRNMDGVRMQRAEIGTALMGSKLELSKEVSAVSLDAANKAKELAAVYDRRLADCKNELEAQHKAAVEAIQDQKAADIKAIPSLKLVAPWRLSCMVNGFPDWLLSAVLLAPQTEKHNLSQRQIVVKLSPWVFQGSESPLPLIVPRSTMQYL